MSSVEQFIRACAQCRTLIAQQLDARDELERAHALRVDEARIQLLQDKVDKLKASTEAEFLKMMAVLPPVS